MNRVTQQLYRNVDMQLDLSRMNKSEAISVKTNSLGRREEEALRGTRVKKEPMLFWVTPDCGYESLLFHSCMLKSQTVPSV